MSKPMADDLFFENLSAATEPARGEPAKTPSRLKAKVYSALLSQQTASGPLLSVSASKATGRPVLPFCVPPR